MGRNQAKGKTGPDHITTASACADCALPIDNMAHMLLTCTHLLPHPWFHTAIIKLAKAAWNPHTPQAERYWTGHITATQLTDAFGRHISSSLLEHQFHVLEKSVTSILLPLYGGGLRMLRNRGLRHHNTDTASVTPITTPPHSQQRPSQDTHPTPKILQLLLATSTPRILSSARVRT